MTPGLHTLGPSCGRECLLFVPPGHNREKPAPLVVMLHGAGGQARHGLDLFQRLAEGAGILLLAPSSQRQTWDLLAGGYGPDITALDGALGEVFSRCAVDPARLAIGGFSDGASYALSVGITNGDLFTHIIAFSPGFMAPAGQRGAPRIFISHGTQDAILPIDHCSRRIAPELQRSGYNLLYHEFDGPHTVPVEIGVAAVEWFVGG